MTAQEPDPRLPARVNRTGGALASVLAWDQHLVTLDRAQMFVIADIVSKFPELNTEAAVDLLADAAGYHKQQMGDWFDRLIDDYGIDAVYMAIECLETTGLRTAEESAANNSLEEDSILVRMLAWFDKLKEAGFPAASADQAAQYMTRLGGWANAQAFTIDQTDSVLSGEYAHHEVPAGDEDDDDPYGRQKVPAGADDGDDDDDADEETYR
jgi:hypothetical protein